MFLLMSSGRAGGCLKPREPPWSMCWGRHHGAPHEGSSRSVVFLWLGAGVGAPVEVDLLGALYVADWAFHVHHLHHLEGTELPSSEGSSEDFLGTCLHRVIERRFVGVWNQARTTSS